MKIELDFYNDVWMDNGSENFYRILKDFEDKFLLDICINNSQINIEAENTDEFVKLLSDIIQNNRNSLIVKSKDKKTSEIKEIKKDFILIQEGSKIGGKVAFKENIYSDTQKSVEDIFDLVEKDGKKTCIICGNSFSKPYKKLQQATYPFVTKIKSLSGVRSYKDGIHYSFKEYHDNFCPKCYLIGILQWLDTRVIYRTFPGDKSFLFLPYFDNFKELCEFKDDYAPLLNNTERYSNIRVNIGEEKTEGTPGKYSTLLCFYEKFLVDVEYNNTAGKDWAVIEIPWGSVKNVKLKTLNLSDSTLGLLKNLFEEKEIRIYVELIKKIQFYVKNTRGYSIDFEITNQIREKLSESIFTDNFRNFASSMIPRNGGNVGFSREDPSETRENLESLIQIWRLEKMGITKESLSSIKSVGNIIAKVSKNNISLLYKLDKARTIEDFWSVLREISRKLIGLDMKKAKVRPMALDELIQLLKDNEKQWTEIRDLLVIYSSMYYAIGSRGEENE